jgi:hypothetical protein
MAREVPSRRDTIHEQTRRNNTDTTHACTDTHVYTTYAHTDAHIYTTHAYTDMHTDKHTYTHTHTSIYTPTPQVHHTYMIVGV